VTCARFSHCARTLRWLRALFSPCGVCTTVRGTGEGEALLRQLEAAGAEREALQAALDVELAKPQAADVSLTPAPDPHLT
jgi:hypothetical protein